MPPASWPDVEALVVSRVAPVVVAELDPLGDYRLDGGTDTPEDLAGRLWFRVGVVNGNDDGLTDTAIVDVEAFAPTRELAADLALALRHAVHQLAGTGEVGALVDSVRTVARPRFMPYANPNVYRFGATYAVATRLQ